MSDETTTTTTTRYYVRGAYGRACGRAFVYSWETREEAEAWIDENRASYMGYRVERETIETWPVRTPRHEGE